MPRSLHPRKRKRVLELMAWLSASRNNYPMCAIAVNRKLHAQLTSWMLVWIPCWNFGNSGKGCTSWIKIELSWSELIPHLLERSHTCWNEIAFHKCTKFLLGGAEGIISLWPTWHNKGVIVLWPTEGQEKGQGTRGAVMAHRRQDGWLWSSVRGEVGNSGFFKRTLRPLETKFQASLKAI